MKSTLTKREKEQRAEWVVNRMDSIRKGNHQGTIAALVELPKLKKEYTWLTR